MKVLQVIDSLAMGGAEKLLLDTIPLYVEKGIEMDIAVLNDNNYPFMQELENQKCCKIYKLSNSSVYNPLLIFKLAKIINNYDVIHVHLFPAQYWVVFAKLIRFTKVKLIFTEHSTENKRLNNKLFLLVDKLIYKAYKKVVAISIPVYKVLSKKVKLLNKQLELIYNGVNLNKYKFNNELSKNIFFDKNSIVLIQISRFDIQKDQKTLIKSLSFLSDKYCLLLVGDGPLRKECEELSKKLGLSNRVKFLGRRTDIPSLLSMSDIAIQSSVCEGFGLVVVEAMSVGKPVIASNVEGMSEIVENYGVLFPVGDDKQLANEILKLEDQEYRKNIVLKCQKRAEEFNINKMVDGYIKLYEEIS